ncbi:methyltransferase [Thermococcus sp.]|uniref:methyltransferase family protein n=1 Tax=Thermococcus sp. TaxID=35749 RepID=UPI00262C6141|nr:methyltransferase [Thermococcus sp.]
MAVALQEGRSLKSEFATKFAFWFSWWAVIILVGIYTGGKLPGRARWLTVPLGIFLMAYGLLLNSIAGRTLKKYGHFDIRKGIRKPEKLVTVGIYSCMRHPAQFGSIFFGWGLAFLTSNVYAIVLAGWYSFSALYFILAIEERETLREFEKDYCRFLAERPPFNPSPRCLREGLRALRNGPAPPRD